MDAKNLIPDYPEFTELSIAMRPVLHPLFAALQTGVSEHTFANLYLFRDTHRYKIASLGGGKYVITGSDSDCEIPGPERFFVLPFGLPGTSDEPGKYDEKILAKLFDRFDLIKCASESLANTLASLGFKTIEDRDNFDYIYNRTELAEFKGGRFLKKKQLVNAFKAAYKYAARPLTAELTKDALTVLENWCSSREGGGDCRAATEAVGLIDRLELTGRIFYASGAPIAYNLGETITGAGGAKMFAVHFEKAVDGIKGLRQFIVQDLAANLPKSITHINREQDLGLPGLREAKTGFRHTGFVKKYCVTRS